MGIAVYVSLAAITGDIRRQTQEIVEGYNTDIVVLARGAANPLTSAISWADFRAIEGFVGPDDVSPVVLGSLRETWNPYVLLVGTTERCASTFRFVEGRPLSGTRGEVLVGHLVADSRRLRPGSKLSLSDESFTVAGIYSLGSRYADGGVVLELSEAQRLLHRKDSVNLALVRVRPKARLAGLARSLNERFPRLRATSGGDFVASIRIFRTVDAFARAVALVALAAALILVSNTLLLSVSERTREIGILTAIGWSPARLLRMLLCEAAILCVLGAFFGNALSFFILRELRRSDAIGFAWIPVTASWSAFAVSLGLALLIAVASLAYPAFVALRLTPGAALRYE